jgi:lipopolysaccharide transport system permease protein
MPDAGRPRDMSVTVNPIAEQELPPSQAAAPVAQGPVTRIEPARGWARIGLKDIWAYRELLGFLVLRDIKLRYKQTVLGVGWAIIQPVFTMLIFSVFFGRLAKVPSDGVPYPLFAFSGLLPWTLFTYGLTQSSNSIVGTSNLIKKVYFPRLVIPISAVLSGLPDFFLALGILAAMMVYYGAPVPGMIGLLWIPALLLLVVVAALGVGLWLSALNVRYRDVRYVLPFLTQFWMFATPIAYPASLLEQKWRVVYALNPMVGVVEGFRWALLGTGQAPRAVLLVSASAALLTLLFGALYFRRMESTFADTV